MAHFSPRYVLVCSKTTTQILAWMTLVAVVFQTVPHTVPYILAGHTKKYWIMVAGIITFPLALVFLLPGGVLGDGYWGRYKTVACGMLLIAFSMTVASISSMLALSQGFSISHNWIVVLLIFSFLLGILGFSLFGSNILQFGLDQLMEKPSEGLGVFVHWLVWTTFVGKLTTNLFYAFLLCTDDGETFVWFAHAIPILYSLLFIVFLIIAYCTRHHFNRDRVKYNPYKMIFKVLNFARKNKYPVGPVSAFAHCYDYRPSRLDYAKERYGGPFTTSDVEDVKSCKNIFFLLLSCGFVFILEAPTDASLFKKLTNHVGDGIFIRPGANQTMTCEQHFNIMHLSSLAVVILFPMYIWFNYCVLRNRPLKILHRFIAAISLFILSVVSMLVIDLAGHVALYTQNQTQPMCMFVQEGPVEQTLYLHWTVLVFPGFVNTFSNTLLQATGLEFISAQSPHTMQGVVVGGVFAIAGIFSVLGVFLLIPFSLEGIWKDGYLGQHPPVVSCGFGYYLVCITVAMIGFISFIVAVKRYKYRRRDEEPYSQACVEEIFARRIESRGQFFDYEELSGTNEY